MEQLSVDSPPTRTMEAVWSPLLGRTSVSLPRTPGCLDTATLSSLESSQSCSSFPRQQSSAPLDAGATFSPSARSTPFSHLTWGISGSRKSWNKNIGCWNASEDVPAHPWADDGHPRCSPNDCHYALRQEVGEFLNPRIINLDLKTTSVMNWSGSSPTTSQTSSPAWTRMGKELSTAMTQSATLRGWP